MAQFQVGDRVRYTGPTTKYVRKGDTGTVTKESRDGALVFANWDNRPEQGIQLDWCVSRSDVHRADASWLRRNAKAIAVGVAVGLCAASVWLVLS